MTIKYKVHHSCGCNKGQFHSLGQQGFSLFWQPYFHYSNAKNLLNIPKCIHHFGIPYIAQSPTTLNALGNVDWVGCPMLG